MPIATTLNSLLIPSRLSCSLPPPPPPTTTSSLSQSEPDRPTMARRSAAVLILSSCVLPQLGFNSIAAAAAFQPSVGGSGFREYIDTFDGYSFKYPKNWIQVRGAGADIFFRDPFILDENLSMEFSSPSSSQYKSVEELGTPQDAANKVLKQCLTEFMSTRLGVRREPKILTTSSRIADDGKLYYQVEVNIKSYACNNELAVMPQDKVVQLEWDRRYLSVLGVKTSSMSSGCKHQRMYLQKRKMTSMKL